MMRLVLQRVHGATASENDRPVAEIRHGLVVYVGIGREDTTATAERMASKIANLRIFEDGSSTFGRSLLEAGGEVLLLSQMTLLADTSRGRRPNFSRAASPERARELCTALAGHLESQGVRRVVAGPYQSRLMVEVRNWGPFTVVLDSS